MISPSPLSPPSTSGIACGAAISLSSLSTPSVSNIVTRGDTIFPSPFYLHLLGCGMGSLTVAVEGLRLESQNIFSGCKADMHRIVPCAATCASRIPIASTTLGGLCTVSDWSTSSSMLTSLPGVPRRRCYPHLVWFDLVWFGLITQRAFYASTLRASSPGPEMDGQRRAPVITYPLYTWAPAPTIFPLATPPSSSCLSGIVIAHASRQALLLDQSSKIGPFSYQERPSCTAPLTLFALTRAHRGALPFPLHMPKLVGILEPRLQCIRSHASNASGATPPPYLEPRLQRYRSHASIATGATPPMLREPRLHRYGSHASNATGATPPSLREPRLQRYGSHASIASALRRSANRRTNSYSSGSERIWQIGKEEELIIAYQVPCAGYETPA